MRCSHDVYDISSVMLVSVNEKTDSKDTTAAYKQTIGVKVPKIYWNLTRTAVLTMEWVDGIKLTDEIRLREACLNRKQLIDEVIKESRATSYGICLLFNFIGCWLLICIMFSYFQD